MIRRENGYHTDQASMDSRVNTNTHERPQEDLRTLKNYLDEDLLLLGLPDTKTVHSVVHDTNVSEVQCGKQIKKIVMILLTRTWVLLGCYLFLTTLYGLT